MNPFGFVFMAVGFFSMAGGIYNWEWFMNNSKARFMSAILTRTGARIFYVMLGFGFVIFGTLVTMGVIREMP